MACQGYAIFVRLLREGHQAEQMGFKGTPGDVSRWSSRVNLARSFRGLQVDGYSERTLQGYNAFFHVFLTHSALERYLPIVGYTDEDLRTALVPYRPQEPISQFFALDRSGKLFSFLHSRLKPKLRNNLAACRDGACHDVSCISAAVRHIFAHGHLAANSNDINPKQVACACTVISEFLLDFMENDFSRRIADYYERRALVTSMGPSPVKRPDGEPELTDELKAELDRRLKALDKNPDTVVPWEVVEARTRERFKE